jgi:SMI1-KNR4 cell-wall
MKKYFVDFDFSEFWDDSKYALKTYVSRPPSDALIAEIEGELGYKLPGSYIALMKLHNGGIPSKLNFPTDESTSWAEDHIAITGIFGIGRDKDYSLGGGLGSQFWMGDWGYPNIGVYFADCPSAGHDMILLDYSKCGKNGEPEVVHVDQEADYKKTFLAKDFETFIRGLVGEEEYDTSEEDYLADEKKIHTGKFSPLLKSLCKKFHGNASVEKIIRAISLEILKDKKHFSLHADERSYLLYDIQFLLFSHVKKINKKDEYLAEFPQMIVFTFGETFGTGGYSPDFVEDWLKHRSKNKQIVESKNGLVFSEAYRLALLQSMKQYE